MNSSVAFSTASVSSDYLESPIYFAKIGRVCMLSSADNNVIADIGTDDGWVKTITIPDGFIPYRSSTIYQVSLRSGTRYGIQLTSAGVMNMIAKSSDLLSDDAVGILIVYITTA